MIIAFDKGPSGRIRGLRELLADISQEDVLKSLHSFSLVEAQELGYGESTDYDLIFEERTYPPKAIFGYAAQRIFGRPLAADEFSGGEHSPCFLILRSLGFQITNKVPMPQSNSTLAGLVRGNAYDRQEISQIFDPGSKFTLGAGRWGLSGIVEVPSNSSNFAFLVTIGKPHKGKPYRDELTEDGFLIWESQKQHTMDSPVIQKLLTHDPEQNNIHLFLRGTPELEYTYFGLLKYFSHDQNSSAPVHFIWRVLNWDFDLPTLKSLRIEVRSALNPAYTPTVPKTTSGKLVQVEPPQARPQVPSTSRSRRKASVSEKEVDWAARDLRNRHIGLEGEKLILRNEIELLKAAGRADLANMVKHVALVNSTAGYDIASFAADGAPKRIEVKTTQGPVTAAFFISINEVLASREDPSSYWIYRVFNFKPDTGSAEFFVINGDVEDSCELMPTNFRARPVT